MGSLGVPPKICLSQWKMSLTKTNLLMTAIVLMSLLKLAISFLIRKCFGSLLFYLLFCSLMLLSSNVLEFILLQKSGTYLEV